MEDKKQRISGALLWGLVVIAFITIIMILLCKYIARGQENALESSQEKLANHTSIWAENVQLELTSAIYYGEILESIVKEEGVDNTLSLSYMQAVVSNTDVSHIVMCRNKMALFNELHERYINLEIQELYSTEEKIDVFVVDNTPFGEGQYFVINVNFDGMEEHCLLFIKASDIENKFKDQEFNDVSFLVVVNEDGKVVGSFENFKDLDSPYISSENIYDAISDNLTDLYAKNSFFDAKSESKTGSVSVSYNGDNRTISISPIGVKNWFLIYGVRQAHVDRFSSSNFQTTRSAAVKLVIVLIVFSLFMGFSIVFNMIKSKERGKALEDRADTDLLTELNNKAATERKITEYIDENPSGRALLFILDIDNFKKINDTMGHAFGDTLLKTLGKEISAEFRVSDIIGRTGGDEFMVFLKNVNDDIIVQREVSRITKFFQEFKAGGDYVKYSATASIGAAVFPDDAKNFRDLYIAADSALYRAKKRGKNQLVFFNEDNNIQSK